MYPTRQASRVRSRAVRAAFPWFLRCQVGVRMEDRRRWGRRVEKTSGKRRARGRRI